MLRTGTYVEFSNPERTENMKGLIVRVRKDLFGSFKKYEVLSSQGKFTVYSEKLKTVDIIPKLADVELATDELLSKTLEISMQNPVDENVNNLWERTVSEVNQERQNFNKRYLYEVLGQKEYSKFVKATLK